MALFAGLDRAYGVYHEAKKHVEGVKVKGRALTETKLVTVELWEKHLGGEQGLGIIPIRDNGTVSWAVIDVDVYPLDIDVLELRATELKLPLIITRSKSGGAHLFLFCAEPMQARYVRGKLQEWAILLGYPGVEIFPKQSEHVADDVGNWLNMPYFDMAATRRPAIYQGKPLSAEDFLEFAAGRRITKTALDAYIVGGDEMFLEGPPCLQTLTKQGFPKGSRNKGLFNLGVFAKMRFGDDWGQKVDDLNQRYMNPPLSTGEVMMVQKSLSKKTYFYSCTQDPIFSVCNKEICRTRKYGIGKGDETGPPVMIGGITKFKSNPPMYVVEVEGSKFQCDADDIINQTRFRKLVFEHTNRIIPLLKGSLWDSLINEKMEIREEIEAPADAGPEGQFLSHLENFCTSRVSANNLDEIILGKPFINIESGRTYFRSPDLIRYLESQHFREFNERNLWAILKRLNGEHHQFMIKGKCVTAWSIGSFKAQDAPFEVPKIAGDEM